jgi:hypothetical protein
MAYKQTGWKGWVEKNIPVLGAKIRKVKKAKATAKANKK